MAPTVEVGIRLWNNGDICNPSHFGTVTKIGGDPRFGQWLEIKPDEDSGYDHGSYRIQAYIISQVFKGHSGTRIVTEAAYYEWRLQQIAALKVSAAKYLVTPPPAADGNGHPEVFRDVNGFYWASFNNQETFVELSLSDQPATIQAVNMDDYIKLSWLHDVPNDLKPIAEIYAQSY